tara:strand:- start:2206 stop:2313 length:108 start_codon:yes stop_codon:yes gene_type:complete
MPKNQQFKPVAKIQQPEKNVIFLQKTIEKHPESAF